MLSNLVLPLLGSGVIVEVVEWASELPVGEDERKSADYHGKGGQLCYCLALLYVCIYSRTLAI